MTAPLMGDDDRRVAVAVLADQREQRRRIAGIEPDTAMRCRAAEAADLIGSVDGVASAEEDCVRHRRIVVDRRAPDALQAERLVVAGRRDIAEAGRRYRPDIASSPVY